LQSCLKHFYLSSQEIIILHEAELDQTTFSRRP
jgi:hypothetical protein